MLGFQFLNWRVLMVLELEIESLLSVNIDDKIICVKYLPCCTWRDSR